MSSRARLRAVTAAIAYIGPDPRTWGALPTMERLVAERDARGHIRPIYEMAPPARLDVGFTEWADGR